MISTLRPFFTVRIFWWLERLGDVWEIVIFQPSKSWLFWYFFWILLVNGTVISLVHFSFGTSPYAAKKKQIDISNILHKFIWYILYLLTEHAVLLFFSLVNNMSCHLFQPFLTVFLIVSSLHLPPRPRANATSYVLYNPPSPPPADEYTLLGLSSLKQ